MARPIVGDVRIKQERRHLNNGKVYVYGLRVRTSCKV